MRACLESHHATKNQQRMMAAAIALHSVQLATNANGALLLTWFLDTCNFPNRRTVLAPHLVPHLVHLCTHKVAYLTVLKVINQKNEPEARDTILKALFFSPGDHVLEDILKDHSCGATLIFKVLTTPFFEETMRAEVVQNVRNVLLKLKAAPAQGYKRLMDEVGLSTRNGMNGAPKDRDNGSTGRRSNQPSNHGTPTQTHRTLGNVPPPPYYSAAAAPLYDPATLAAAGGQYSQAGQFDQSTLRALEQLNLNAQLYGVNPALQSPALQYQLLQQQMAGARPTTFFGNPGMGHFGGQQGSDQFRVGQSAGPLPPPGMGSPMMGAMSPAFNPLVAQQLMSGYPYGGVTGVNGLNGAGGAGMFAQQAPQAQHGGGGRRGGRR